MTRNPHPRCHFTPREYGGRKGRKVSNSLQESVSFSKTPCQPCATKMGKARGVAFFCNPELISMQLLGLVNKAECLHTSIYLFLLTITLFIYFCYYFIYLFFCQVRKGGEDSNLNIQTSNISSASCRDSNYLYHYLYVDL